MAIIERLTLRQVNLPLRVPYWSMISTLHALDALVVEAEIDDGRTGWGEAVIVHGYTHESVDGGWAFALDQAADLPGQTVEAAIARLQAHTAEQSHAVTALVAALEMAQGSPVLAPQATERRVPVVAGVSANDLEGVRTEVPKHLAAGYRTLKVKVGQDVHADLQRVREILRVVDGTAVLRLDANQGFSPEDACRFASQLPEEGVELFEQGSQAGNWDAAVAIKQASKVPVMLDESIFTLDDIDRAAQRQAAHKIKLKLVKCGGVAALGQALTHIDTLGMDAVLGNGVATEIGNWMEACVAHRQLRNAGEMNGFTRPRDRLLANPLSVEAGQLVIPANWYPEVDADRLSALTTRQQHFHAA